MQSTVCKRIAKSFQLQRYIPEYQVYELCIHWQSEIPTPPTIFYLSEIFIYPYNSHHLPANIKKEIAIPVTNILVDTQTVIEQNMTVVQKEAKPQAAPIQVTASEAEPAETTIKALDYDKIVADKPMVEVIKQRNREIVRHIQLKGLSDARKKRKT